MSRRALLGAAGLTAFQDGHAAGQEARRPSRILVGFPPGGATDTIARLFAERLRHAWRRPVVVENRPGAGGRLAAEAVKAAPPDGTTILLTPGSILTIYPHTHRAALRYDALTDFVPVSPICASPYALMIAGSHRARDFAEFLAMARRLEGPLSYASPAAGSAPHFVGVQLGKITGIGMEHVPYRGMAPALQDLLTGHLMAVVCVLGEGAQLHRAGISRILAVSSPQRIPSLPEIPTFAELGHQALTSEEWFGMLLPAGTPAEIVISLRTAIATLVQRDELRDALAGIEYRPFSEPSWRFVERIRSDQARWAPIIAASGFDPNE